MSENALCAPEEYAERDIAMTLMPDAYAAFNDHSGIERTCAAPPTPGTAQYSVYGPLDVRE